jgi:hypothetical protein
MNHNILLTILPSNFRIAGLALKLLTSYLVLIAVSHFIKSLVYAGGQKDAYPVNCCVTQDYVMSPVEFVAYTKDIINAAISQLVSLYLYLDDV